MSSTLSSGQITLTDLNDAIVAGTAPSNPTVNQLWVDTSVNPNLLKKWTGSAWSTMGEVASTGTSATATNNNTTLGNMANDNIIDVTERQTVKDKLTSILGFAIYNGTTTLPTTATLDSGSTTDNGASVSTKGSFYTARKSAQNAGLSTSDTNYTNLATQYTNLKTYLEGLTPIDAWDVSSTNQSSNITVVKDTWRTNWLNYYNAEEALDQAVALKLKQNVDNVQVGGRNLLKNSDFRTDITSWSGAGNHSISWDNTDTYNSKNSIKITSTGAGASGNNVSVTSTNGITNGQVYTLSFYAKTISGNATLHTELYGSVGATNFTLTTSWQLFTVQLTGSTTNALYFWLSGTGVAVMTMAKLEVGNKPTDWSNAPEDIPAVAYDTVFNVNKQNIISTVTSSQQFNTALTTGIGDFVFNNGGAGWVTTQGGTTAISPSAVVKDAIYGANSIQLTGSQYVFFGTPIPVNTTKTYRVKFRVKQTTDPTTSGQSMVYAGVASFDINKANLTTSTYGTHRYCAVAGVNITASQGWQEFIGNISGEGDEGYTQFITGTKYAVPMFIVNYSGGNGVALVDCCTLEEITDIDSLGKRVSNVEQSITPDGITTVIQKSTFYGDYQTAMTGKADTSKLSDYALASDLDTTNTNLQDLSDTVGGMDLTKYATTAYVDQTSQDLTTKFSASGGMNLLKNSIGFSDFISKTDADNGIKQNWFLQGVTSRVMSIETTELNTLGFGSGFQFSPMAVTNETSIDQYINVIPNKTYTLSWYAKKTNASPSGNDDGALRFFLYEYGQSTQISVTYPDPNDNTNTISDTQYKYNSERITNGYETQYITFTPKTNKVQLRIYGHSLLNAVVTGLMFTIGDVALQWSLATGESFNTNVRLDINGIRVSQLDGSYNEIGYTQITPSEFAGYYDTDGNGTFEKVFYLNGDETVTKKLTATDAITMGSIKIVNVNANGYNGWAFTIN